MSKNDSAIISKDNHVLRQLFLGSASTLALLAVATSTFAQVSESAVKPTTEAPSTTSDDSTVVVVTGIRNSLQTASRIKRKASTFVDSITASDVSSLPDLSVAEALQRVPGVTVTRFSIGGSPDFPSPEGRGNLIRGLGFVRSEFNGRDAFSANAGRSLDWSSIPPQLVGAVDVFKNSSADLIEGGIGGTINLRTLQPFDRKGYFAAVSMDVNYGDLAKKFSPSYNGVIGNRWQTGIGEIGLVGSLSTSNLKSTYNGWQQGAPIPRSDLVDGKTVGVVEGFQLRTSDIDRNRDSLYLAGQWRNDTMLLTANYIKVINKTESIEYTLESFPDGSNNQSYAISDATYDTSWTSAGLNRCNVPSVDLNATPPRGVDFCETQFPVDGGLMTAGGITNSADSWIGAYGLGAQVLGIGKKDKSVTEDLSLNFKWRPADHWFVELDAQKTKALASSTEIWGGSQTWADVYLEPGLDNPKVTLTPNAQTQIHAGNVAGAVQTGVDADGNAIYAYTPGVQTSTADPNASFWLYAGEGHHDGTGDLTAVKADIQYDFADDSWFKSVKFGARYSDRSQINKEMDVNWSSVAPAWDDTGLGLFSTETTPAYTTVDFSDFYRGGVVQGENTKFLAISSELLLDPVKLANYMKNEPTFNNADGTSKIGWTSQLNADGSVNYDPARISDISEKTANLYGMINFGKSFDNGMSIDGNFGVRYTATVMNSAGYMAYKAFDEDSQTASTTAAPRTADAESRDAPQDFLPETTQYLLTAAKAQTVKEKDSHWLPSFNLKWNLNSEMLIRFGASQNLSRPNIQDMRAGQVTNAVTTSSKFTEITDETDPLYGVDRGYSNISLDQIRITGGNPNLKPTTSNNYDLSWEWYFKGGTVSTALFQKDLKNIIQNGDITMGSTTLDGKTVNIVYSGLVNVDTASVKGVELAYQQFYDFLPSVFSHLGLQTNFTFVDASAEPPPPYVDANGDGVPDDFGTIYRFGVKDLLGQSKYIFNIVGIYQDKKWEGRIAYNWRSENLTSYRDYITGDPIYLGDVGFLDASLKYTVNKNLQISLNASNLLDTKNKAYAMVNADGQRVDRFSFLNDRRFVLDLRYQY